MFVWSETFFFSFFFFKERLLDSNNEKSKSHVDSLLKGQATKNLLISFIVSPLLLLIFKSWLPKLSSRGNSPGPSGCCISLPSSALCNLLALTVLTEITSSVYCHSLYTLSQAFPLHKISEAVNTPLKSCILRIADNCGRMKKNADLTIYCQKPHNKYSEEEGIHAINFSVFWLSAFRVFFFFIYWFKSKMLEKVYIPATHRFLSSKHNHHQRKIWEQFIFIWPLKNICSIKRKIRNKRWWNKTLLGENIFTSKENSLLS